MNYELLGDSVWRGPLVLAMQRAMLAEFNSSDWHELGYLTGCHDYIRGHARLLRSLGFGDDDYGACIFQALEHFANNGTQALVAVVDHPKVRPHLEREQAAKLIEMGYQAGHVPAVLPTVSASEVVRRALHLFSMRSIPYATMEASPIPTNTSLNGLRANWSSMRFERSFTI